MFYRFITDSFCFVWGLIYVQCEALEGFWHLLITDTNTASVLMGRLEGCTVTHTPSLTNWTEAERRHVQELSTVAATLHWQLIVWQDSARVFFRQSLFEGVPIAITGALLRSVALHALNHLSFILRVRFVQQKCLDTHLVHLCHRRKGCRYWCNAAACWTSWKLR